MLRWEVSLECTLSNRNRGDICTRLVMTHDWKRFLVKDASLTSRSSHVDVDYSGGSPNMILTETLIPMAVVWVTTVMMHRDKDH